MKTEKRKRKIRTFLNKRKNLSGGKTTSLCFVIAYLDRNNHNIVMSGCKIIQNKYKKRRPTNDWKIGKKNERGEKKTMWMVKEKMQISITANRHTAGQPRFKIIREAKIKNNNK